MRCGATSLPGPYWSGARGAVNLHDRQLKAVSKKAAQEKQPVSETDCVVVVVVVVVVSEWLIFQRIIVVQGADLSKKKKSLIFVGKMCVFVSRPMNIVTFSCENGPKMGCWFRENTFRKKHGNR